MLDAELASRVGRPTQKDVREDADVLAPVSRRELRHELLERRPERLRGEEEGGEVLEGDDVGALGVGSQAMVRRGERQLGEVDGRSGRHREAKAGDVARRADNSDRRAGMRRALDALGQVEEREEVALRQEGEEEEVAGAALAVLLLVTHDDKQIAGVEWTWHLYS